MVNEDYMTYNDAGLPASEYRKPFRLDFGQHRHGVVTDSTPYVGYNYDAGNGYRLASIQYPNLDRTVSYNYGETGTPDDSLDRLSTITDDSTGQTLAAYSYLGLDTVATEDFQQPKIKLDYSGGNDTYTALDRFGRVRDQIWSDYGNDTTADGYSYTYEIPPATFRPARTTWTTR